MTPLALLLFIAIVPVARGCQINCECIITTAAEVQAVNDFCTCCNIMLPAVTSGDFDIAPGASTGPFHVKTPALTGTQLQGSLFLRGHILLGDSILWSTDCHPVVMDGLGQHPLHIESSQVRMPCVSVTGNRFTLQNSANITMTNSVVDGGVGVTQVRFTATPSRPALSVVFTHNRITGSGTPVAVDLQGSSDPVHAAVVLVGNDHGLPVGAPDGASTAHASFQLAGFDGTQSVVANNTGRAWAGIRINDSSWIWAARRCFEGSTDFPLNRLRCIALDNRHTVRVVVANAATDMLYQCTDMCPGSAYATPVSSAPIQYVNTSMHLSITPAARDLTYSFHVRLQSDTSNVYRPVVHMSPSSTTCSSFPSSFGTTGVCQAPDQSFAFLQLVAEERQWALSSEFPTGFHYERNFSLPQLLGCGAVTSTSSVFTGLVCAELVTCAPLAVYHSQCVDYSIALTQVGSVMVFLQTSAAHNISVAVDGSACVNGRVIAYLNTTTPTGVVLALSVIAPSLNAASIVSLYNTSCVLSESCTQPWALIWHNGFSYHTGDTVTVQAEIGYGNSAHRTFVSFSLQLFVDCTPTSSNSSISGAGDRHPGTDASLTGASSEGLSTGVVVAIAVGAVVAVALLVGAIYWWYRASKEKLVVYSETEKHAINRQFALSGGSRSSSDSKSSDIDGTPPTEF